MTHDTMPPISTIVTRHIVIHMVISILVVYCKWVGLVVYPYVLHRQMQARQF